MSIDMGVWFEPAPIAEERVVDRHQDLRAGAVEDEPPTHPLRA
ncbi:hypothetical protein OHA72_20340 [Dactylosporangium sp. NBC_01737]|nr:hypothetical protein OHA72_20340 [Dactylosporangium sp. NBC_01737]